ncbi:DUF4265 domain-containing protein [Agreia bicolorata]|uniref:DUF4265 domain-containing protein n=1 Tax=Agreia bicolorata TaxID=110935 RepID=UPI0006969EAE|nr:DUF4265 domain-containing protein [Agreia bicolorata]
MAAALVALVNGTQELPNHVSEQVYVHESPLLRDEANYIFRAVLPDGSAEQLWGKKVGESTVEVCCIPFFIYNVALRDIVQLNEERRLAFVLESSGRFVGRVWFGDSRHAVEGTVKRLEQLGANLEWSSANLLAVDSSAALQDAVVEFLSAGHNAGAFLYENGYQADISNP